MKTDKKITTVAEMAKKIGLNHLALRLLNYLDQYHPDLALDYDFIMERANYAASVRDKIVKRSNENSALLQEAESECNRMLMADLEFSEHSIIFDIVDNYYYEQNDTKTPVAVKQIAIELRPQLKTIFAKYPIDNPEFTAEVEYDEMIEELTKEIEKLLQKRDELPF
jgi:cysteinyl-tRNA synthetase